MKECSKCKRLLSESSFKVKKGKPYYICKECEREYMLQYRRTNRKALNEQHREYMKKYKEENSDRMRTYSRNYYRTRNNIPQENYRGPNDSRYINNRKGKAYLYNIKYFYGLTEEEFNKMPKFCEVCGSTDRLCIDHNHETGKVRGILCCRCNAALGMLKDNPVYIDKLKEYLVNSLSED